MPEFLNWFRERLAVLARLVAQIILDAVLFVVWLGIAWIVQFSSEFFTRHGLHEYFAIIFKWASSCGTLIMTLLYIARDIKDAWANLISPPNTD
jgi:hypothetical protein